MKQRPVHGSTSSLFLIELIIAAGFLSLTAAACVRLYLYAQEVSEESSDVTHAVNEAQNMAESYLAGDGSLAEGLNLYLETVQIFAAGENAALSVSASVSSENTVFVLYDEDWNVIGVSASAGSGCTLYMEVNLAASSDAADLYTLSISVVRKDSGGDMTLFSIEAARYLPGGVRGDTGEVPNNAEAAQDDTGETQSDTDGALDDAGSGWKEAS